MNWFSALVLLAVYWFMTLFIVLPLRLKTQAEDGAIVEGTPGSAPADANIKRKFLLTSLIAFVLWVISLVVILKGWITLDDFDLFTRFGGSLD